MSIRQNSEGQREEKGRGIAIKIVIARNPQFGYNVESADFERWRHDMLEFRYDTQLLIEGEDLDEDEISEYFTENFQGDCLLAVGDEELIKIHFHTNEPWKVLEYCAGLGEIYDIVIEDMDRQARGLKG